MPAQPGATERLLLQSNENCDYYVDGVNMIRGKRVRLLVTKANHQIVCKPEGYRAKEENIQPPFNPTHPIGFTFLIEDKLPGSSPGGGPPPPPPQPLVQIQIVIIEPKLGRGIEVVSPGVEQTIRGIVAAPDGISKVLLNGIPAQLSEVSANELQQAGLSGGGKKFSGKVRLTPDQHSIEVRAIDTRDKAKVEVVEVGHKPVRIGEVKASNHRTALVIGNAAYAEGRLTNPTNDANAMAAMLQEMGFQVNLLRDADLRTMDEAVNTFSKQLRQGGVGLFYFAGHGMQVQGENFLLPLGARIEREQDVKYAALPVGRVLGAMEDSGNNLNIIILDACRNNPLARSFRSSQAGLAQVQAVTGSLIAYATAPGSVAADGMGNNGVYTSHLLKNMRRPDLPVEQVFKNVRVDVMKETNGKQTPWESSSLTGNFTFVPSP